MHNDTKVITKKDSDSRLSLSTHETSSGRLGVKALQLLGVGTGVGSDGLGCPKNHGEQAMTSERPSTGVPEGPM